jgi:hypothetical protein
MYTFEELWKTGFHSRTALSKENAQTVFDCARELIEIPGDIAELGIFRGGMSKMLAVSNDKKTVWSLDTFEGIPISEQDQGGHAKGDFAYPYEDVLNYMSDAPNVKIIKGIFPLSATEDMMKRQFSLVHLDADIYRATKDGLDFFWPRLVVGGVILLHDYGWRRCPGVKMAVKEKLETISSNEYKMEIIGIEDSSVNPCIMTYCKITRTNAYTETGKESIQ